MDFPASRSLQGLFAVRLFTCLDKPAPGGGGTVFVAGPHELLKNLVRQEGVEKLHSADARKVLIRTCPWIERLCSFDERIDRVREFMKSEAVVSRLWLRVVEMTGEPGDLWLTDPLMLHARAQNCAEVPRLVLSSIVHRREVPLSAIYQSSS